MHNIKNITFMVYVIYIHIYIYMMMKPIHPNSFPWSWEAAQAMLTDGVIGELGSDVAHLPRAASNASGSQGTQQPTVLGLGNGKGGNKNGKPAPSTRKSHGSELFIIWLTTPKHLDWILFFFLDLCWHCKNSSFSI